MSGGRKGLTLSVALAAALILSGCQSLLPKPGPPPITPGGAFRLKGAPIKGEAAHFVVGTISGPPPDVLFELSAELSRQAGARKINIVRDGDPRATYRLRGYLSAVGDAAGTVLVYVFDVFDARSVRIHRISGQEAGVGTASDPWAGIRDATVRAVARRTVDDLAGWVAD